MFMPIILAAAALLTDNPKGQAFPDEVRRIHTGATITWDETGPYAADKEILATRIESKAPFRSRILNGRLHGDGNCCVWGTWNGTRKVAFTLDLKNPYLISKVTLWSGENLALRGISGYTVALGTDGTNFTAVACRDVPVDFDGGFGKDVHPVPLDCILEKPSVARYVRFLVDRHPGRHQMVLGEVAVWGDVPPIDAAALAPENRRPTVTLRVDGFSSGAAAFDWDGFPAAGDVKEWRFYVSDRPFSDCRAEGVRRLAEIKAKETSYTVYPLVPHVTNHYAVSAVYANGEYPFVKSVAHSPIGPLEVTRFRDMLGMNYYWGGGGANARDIPGEWYGVAADFLSKSPFRRLRWWISPEWALKNYIPRRIEVTGGCGEPDIAPSRKYGVYLHGLGNEPELRPGYTPADCVADHRKVRAKWKDAGPQHLFYGPVVNVFSRGFEYFKKYIEAGGADCVDALDFHTYCGSTRDFEYPDGYLSGAPEAIIPAVARIRAFLKEKGIEKPFTCSEWGFSDTTTANPHMADPTPLRKAQYLVRGCIIHHRLGFRRLFLYSFYDEGRDLNYSEHCFGVVSRDLQKKPAFYALQTMGDVLGDALVDSDLQGLGPGDFGYVFRNVDKPGFATVVWNGARARKGVFKTMPGDVEIVDMFGVRRTVKTKPDGTFRAKFDGSPVYFTGPAPVVCVAAEDAAAESNATQASRLAVSAPSDVCVFGAGEKPTLSFKIENASGAACDIQLTLTDWDGRKVREEQASVPGDDTRAFAFPVEMRGRALDKFTLSVDYDANGESVCERRSVWVRQLGAATAAASVEEVRFANLDHPVWRIGNGEMELTVDPVQGGQVLEMFEKRGKTNQLNTDYGKLDVLASVPFAYGLWDEVRVMDIEKGKWPWPAFRRARAYTAKPVANGLALEVEDRGLKVTKTFTLAGSQFSMRVEVANASGGSAKVQWHIHPEYTIAGEADSFQDYMLIPTPKGEDKLVFWSGLGERRLNEVTAGWWRMVDPKANFEIRQTYDIKSFEVPKLWFGVGAWNVELFTPVTTLAAGARLSAALDWYFIHGECKGETK